MLLNALTTVTTLAARLPEPARESPPPASPPPRRTKPKPPAAWGMLLAALAPLLGQMQGRI